MAGESQETPGSKPDPSVLATEALQREVATLEREQKERQEALVRETIARAETRKVETNALRQKIKSGRKADRRLIEAELKILHEKFKGQDRILNLIEEQRKERKEDDRRALDAALAAAEKARVADQLASDKANTKTELSTAEQLKQQNATSVQANSGTTALFNTLQTRVERIENQKTAVVEERSERGSNINQTLLIIAGLVGVGGLFVSMISLGAAIYFATRR